MSNLLKIGAASLVGLATLSAYSLSARKADLNGGKKVALKCSCGKFSGSVTLPKNENHKAGLNVVCHCADCFKWASQVVQHGGLTKSQGDQLFMVYNAMVHFDSPDLVRYLRLYDKTSTHRYMTKCCGTAIGVSVPGTPIFGLSSTLVDENDVGSLLAQLSPQYNIRLKDRKNNEEKFAADPLSFADVPAWFIAKYVGFALKGMINMKSPSPVLENPPNEEVVFPGLKTA